MKIFLSFLQSENRYAIPTYDFWDIYIKNGIAEAGHEWVECKDADWALGIVPKSKDEQLKWKQDTWTKTVSWLKNNPVDLFLSYLYPKQVDTSAIAEIQKIGIPCVNFFCDNIREFTKAPVEFCVFDLNWVPENKAIKFYAKAGYKHINLPMPAWIAPADRVIKPESFNQITFLGSRDIQRQMLIEGIIKLAPELPLAIYGSGWNKTQQKAYANPAEYSRVKSLLYQFTFLKEKGLNAYLNKIKSRNLNVPPSAALIEKIKSEQQVVEYKALTAESAITVGVNRYPSFHFPFSQPDTYSRLRDIEAPMLGACYLTEWTEGIDDLYVISDEIETYRSAEDFVEKANELQRDEKKRKKLRINGQKRALADHSISNSLNKIKNKLNLR